LPNRDEQAVTANANRTLTEFCIVAAILVVIVLAAVNSQSFMSGVNCRTAYVGSLCAALTEQ